MKTTNETLLEELEEWMFDYGDRALYFDKRLHSEAVARLLAIVLAEKNKEE